MATLVLGAAGAAIGGSLGGSALGLSSVVIGRAIGATLGQVVDQRVMGAGADVVEQGRMDRLRINGASEGAPIANVYGNYRVTGQIIWTTRFLETKTVTSGGGKGAPSTPATAQYSYSVSLAVAICEGEVSKIGRIWADGVEIQLRDYHVRKYYGTEDQSPDALIQAVEGSEATPAYRGLAYVVFEDLPLGPFGNRVPEFSFEVVRPARPQNDDVPLAPCDLVKGIALIPGTGEYSLATEEAYYDDGLGVTRTANVHSPSGESDFRTSLDDAVKELTSLESTLLVSSWFGNDLRCGSCQVQPKVEQNEQDASGFPWGVGGLGRADAPVIRKIDGKSIYGGTPCDASLVQAIHEIDRQGKDVVFYPFLLMDVLPDDALQNPWSPGDVQPALPWRGRITSSVAAGVDGTPQGTVAAEQEVAAFFGNASASDFEVGEGSVDYNGPEEWSYRRFILHNAAVCASAGGVGAFCIGSEMRGLTQVMGENNSFPAVDHLKGLLAEVRLLLPHAKLGYAADWSEYFGYHSHTGDVFFHLDALWAEPDLDFIGIDNYMPLSDWRDGPDHADGTYRSIYDQDYLMSNVAGGEGYDWYYETQEARDAQRRTPIVDGLHGEHWVFRYKDIVNWWGHTHHPRVGGERLQTPTAWIPKSKPIWFTEIGCAAIDKGTNEPNAFVDAKSVESKLPRFSNGQRDDFLQASYINATLAYWDNPDHNPQSDVYDGRMVNTSRTHVWAWDARPWPEFPNNTDVWSDGGNYRTGHWLNGRMGAQPLSAVIASLCERAGFFRYNVGAVEGIARGYEVRGIQSLRSALQPLLLAYGIDVRDQSGELVFTMRKNATIKTLDVGSFLKVDDAAVLTRESASVLEQPGKVQLTYVAHGNRFDAKVIEAAWAGDDSPTVSQSELPIVLTANEARAIAERWQAESRVARDKVRFSLPMSSKELRVGDLVTWSVDAGLPEIFRVDRLEVNFGRSIEAVKVEPSLFDFYEIEEEVFEPFQGVNSRPVFAQFLDIPTRTTRDNHIGPYLAANVAPWGGDLAVYASLEDSNYQLNSLVSGPSIVGHTETELLPGPIGIWDNGSTLYVKVAGGELSGATRSSVLNGANAIAIGNGSLNNWEIVQFETADLIGDGVYALGSFLRGQNGTEAFARTVWPVGSSIVFLNTGLTPIPMHENHRGLAVNYRVGPASRPLDDPTYELYSWETDSSILRPYAPVHLKLRDKPDGGKVLSWIRRSRVDADTWAGFEVPVGEEQELYLVSFADDAGPIDSYTSETTEFVLPVIIEQRVQSGGGVTATVAQISDRFGPGNAAVLNL